MRRLHTVLALATALFALHACESAELLCACSPQAPSVTGRWVGSTRNSDSLDLSLTRVDGDFVVTGTGRLVPPMWSSLSARTLAVAGSIDPSTLALTRLTIHGWYDEPMEWRATTATAGARYTGTVRFPAHAFNGDTMTLVLRRVGP
jgi:hypothetical protein